MICYVPNSVPSLPVEGAEGFRLAPMKSVSMDPNRYEVRSCGQQLGKPRGLGYLSRIMIEAT
ncbi:hypothetical protein Sinac_4775 [Singulisphaera acidiphila DSM 18658]|uniref:Uncharacterized protein n=1 Tax=Singulisphaera acidiphila (strain ATCC BAA-1392 / DSM 18658 / VKM B-2454 / MOB10) TaxID=886293 RepID=L0DJY0_SINAD|nr:hypothetical protein Sinac_4775 [Singulisphaera acidiphila DSM 18658]